MRTRMESRRHSRVGCVLARAAWMGASLVLGCVGGQARGYPLYPQVGALPDVTQIARLSGYVHFVDGQDVAHHGNVFELLPGCHVVRTPTSWGTSGTDLGGAVMVATSEYTFALPMRAGYQYSVELLTRSPSAPSEAVEIRALERSERGEMVRAFPRAKTTDDIRRCKQESMEESASVAALQHRDERPAAASAPGEGETGETRAERAERADREAREGSAPPTPPASSEAAGPPWPDLPPTPTEDTSLDEAMSRPDVLVAHWARVPTYRSHAAQVAGEPSLSAVVALRRYVGAMHDKVQPRLKKHCRASDSKEAGEGAMEIEAVLDVDGALRDIGVLTSSGSPLYDAAAEEALARAAPFGPTPAEARSAGGLVAVRFRLFCAAARVPSPSGRGDAR